MAVGRDYPEPVVSWLSAGRVRFVLILLAVAAFYAVSWHLARVDPGKLLTGLPRMASWAVKAWPPATGELPVLIVRLAETVAMAAIGTTAAALLALPLAVVAARNVTPSMLLYYPARWFLNALRGIDSFVFALLFVAAVGLGPFAGVLGVALHTWGSTAKLWAEVIENIPPGPLEAAAVTGASRLKVLSFALVPDVAPSMVSIGLFWWEFNLIRRLTAVQNVRAGRLASLPTWRVVLRRFPGADRQIALACLDRVGLVDRAYARADQLSGGQQQRVAIARALAQEARLILADEPVASLDPESAATVLETLRAVAAQGVAVIASLHQVQLAVTYADRIVALRDGRIVEDAPAARFDTRAIGQIYDRTSA